MKFSDTVKQSVHRPARAEAITVLTAVLITLTATLSTTMVQAEGAPRHVIMISIDGLRPEIYLEPERVGVKVPNLVQLREQGTSAERMIPVFPSVTYPGHTTLVTGVNTDADLKE